MGLFSNLFSKKKKEERLLNPIDLSVLGCDMHSHFIPGIDDGAQTIEDSVTLISFFHEWGYKKVITTPHVMSDTYRNTPEIILSGLEKVREALKQQGIPIQVEAAAEYYMDYELEKKIDEKTLLTLGNTKYVLFELSFVQPPDNLYHLIFKMQTQGYKPVLAHPERYNFWHSDFEVYEQLVDKGVALQLNLNSLTGYYSPDVKMIAERLIDNNMVSFLGSDCHHVGHINLLKQVVYEKPLEKLLASGKLLNHTLI
ncbi:MAG: capsular biosynthesis protein [Bacteroidetes bacterium]|nr:capsular biosynthesis protein [Bacteroidota bacterium]